MTPQSHTPPIQADLHAQSIIIDGLNASHFQDAEVLQRLRAGGVTAVNATIAAWHTLPETMALIAGLFALIEQKAGQTRLIHTSADIKAAKDAGQTGIIMGFQDTRPIEANLDLLRVYHALGVRVIQLTYSDQNRCGCGCQVAEDGGLTAFGREAIARMNHLGILLDLSHTGIRTTREAIESSTQPVALSHANAFALCGNPRNKSDELIRLVAAGGGVIGAVAMPFLLTGRADATLDDYVAMIDYLVDVAGINHVGLGPDFMELLPDDVVLHALTSNRAAGSPAELLAFFRSATTRRFESASAFANLTQALRLRGYSTDDTQKIMGGNWLRLYDEVW
jgi:membrane dipeptidase